MAALNSRRGWAKRQREPGVWELRVYAGVDPHTGKKRWISRTFRGGTREASKALAALATEIDGGDHRHDARTVNELFDAWLVHLEARGRAPATLHGYRNKIDKHLRPGLGRRAVSKVTARDLDEIYTSMAKGGLTRSVPGVHRVVHAAFRQAKRWRWINSNPADDATPTTVPDPVPWAPPDATLAALLDEAWAIDPELALYLSLTAHLGTRRSEGLALRWPDVHREAGEIIVDRALYQLPGMSRPAEKDTKTHASGPIPAADTLFELLEAHHDWQRSVAAQADVILAADGFVFADLVSDITGRCPWRPDRATEAMDRLRKRPAVKDQPGAARITVKSLRHYAATVTTSKVGLDVAKRRLRHRHITTTMRYTAAVESRDKAAAKALAPCSQAAVAEGIP